MRSLRVPEVPSPELTPDPRIEHDGKQLPSAAERVTRRRAAGATSGRKGSGAGKTRRRGKRVAAPLIVRPYQVTAIPGRGLGLIACTSIARRTKIDDCFTWELPRPDIKHVTETPVEAPTPAAPATPARPEPRRPHHYTGE